jgi:hypothetical protein
MHARSKLALAALASAITLGAAAGAAASTFTIAEQRFRVVWRELALSSSGGEFAVRCPVTLEGSFHSVNFPKVARSLVGYLNRATVGTCTGGEVAILTSTLPWHVQYDSFAGTLPNITSLTLRVVGLAALVRPTGLLSCLYQTEQSAPARLVIEREEIGELRAVRADETAVIASRTLFCPSGVFRGTGGGMTASEGNVIMSFLGETAETLLEPQQPGAMHLAPAAIPAGSHSGVATIKNRGTQDAWVKAVFLSGLNEGMFEHIATEPEACKLNSPLRRRPGTSCTIRIGFDEVYEGLRPVSTTVKIVLEVAQARTVIASLTVTAQ